MIAWLSGDLILVESSSVILSVGGVGYRVACSQSTIDWMKSSSGQIEAFIESVTREDGTTLYGFPCLEERDWFRLLTSVQGIGGKVAISALGTLGASGLLDAVRGSDAARLKSVPGIGSKVAARLVVELGQKELPGIAGSFLVNAASNSNEDRNIAESALVGLGYNSNQISSAIAQAVKEGLTVPADIVRHVIKGLASAA